MISSAIWNNVGAGQTVGWCSSVSLALSVVT